MYILWSGKLQGWLTRSSTFSSERKDARQLTQEEAIEMAARHYGSGGNNLLPVEVDMMNEIAKAAS